MNHLNAVRLLHLYIGYSTESFNSFALSLTKKGLKCMMGTSSRQKHPITPAILLSIRRSLNLSTPSHAALWALFTTTIFSFLHKSNLVAASASSFNCDLHLAQRGITFTDSGALLRIKWSKTWQFKEGIRIIPLPSIPNSPLCPVLAIYHYFALLSAPSVAPFFCLPTSHSLLVGFTQLTATSLHLSSESSSASAWIRPTTPRTVSGEVGLLRLIKQVSLNN